MPPHDTRQNACKSSNVNADQLTEYQLDRFNALLAEILPRNNFYQTKFGQRDLKLDSLDSISELPYSFKSELMGDEASAGFSQESDLPN